MKTKNVMFLNVFSISRTLILLFVLYANVAFNQNEGHDHNDSHSLLEGKNDFFKLVNNQPDFTFSTEAARFIENKGQWNSNVLFRTELIDGYIYFQKDGIKYHFFDGSAIYDAAHSGGTTDLKIKQHVVNVSFKNANPNSFVEASKTFKQHNQSYFYGKKHINGVRFFQKIEYKNIYPNIDIVYNSFDDHLKYDINVKVGGKPSDIIFDYSGAERISLHKNGGLVIETSIGGIVEYTPFSYQMINGEKTEVESHFKIVNNEVSFVFPNGYDLTKELIIDPTLIASTYTGSTSDNWGNTAAHFADGRMVVAGITNGAGYPTTVGAFDVTFNGGTAAGSGTIASDISISVFSSDGTTLLSSTFLGGSDDEYPHSLVVDQSNGDIFLMGITLSTDFPMAASAFDNSQNGNWDIYVVKLSSDLSTLMGSSYVGGSNRDGNNMDADHDDSGFRLKFNYSDGHRGQLILDNSNNVVVSSSSRSNNFPVTGGAYQSARAGGQDAVVFKMNNNLSSMIFSTYLGGGSDDGGFGVSLDATNNIFISGATRSNDYPTTNGVIDQTFNGDVDGFLAKLNPSGTSLLASTFLGTGDKDGAFYVDVDVDVNDDVFVFGLSLGGNYTVTAGTYSDPNSTQFIHSVSNDLATTNFSSVYGSGNTGLGGRSNISPTGFEVDSCSNIIAVGWGNFVGQGTTGMPTTTGAHQTTTDGIDFHLVVFDPGMTGLRYATFFGENGGVGDHVDGGSSTFDNKGVIYQAVCASCGSTNGFPITAGAFSSNNNSTNCNNAVFKFDLDVYAPGSAVITTGGSGCANIPITFTNSSSNSLTYLWNFGDGTSTSSAFQPTHTYATAGSYNVTLIAYNPTTCIKSDTATVTIVIDQPSITITTNPATGIICDGDNVTFTGAGATTFEWNPGAFTGNPYIDAPTTSTTYTVIGTDANGCKDTTTVTITVDQLPTVSNAGASVSVCETPGTTALNGNIPVTGTGLWTLVSGTGTIVNPTSPSTNVTGLGVGTNVFEWTISNGACSSSTSQVTINVDADATIANAGPDSTLCETSPDITLYGNTPTVGTGTWSVFTGTGTVTTINDPNSTATGLSVGSNVFVWSMDNGSCATSTDTVIIVVNTTPSVSNANSDQTIYANNGTFSGNAPTSGNGTWVQISGPNSATITNVNDPASTFTGLIEGVYVFEWNISNSPCTSSTDQVTITVDLTNDAPSQGNETMTVDEDDPATTSIDLTINNIDPDGTATDVTTIVSTTGGGTVTNNGDGTVDYTPAPNFNGIDTVIYTVCDNGLPLPVECVNDTLFVTVNPIQDAPSQGNETMTVGEDDPATTSIDLTINNIDPDGTATDVTTIVSTTGGGTVTNNGNGTVDYTPSPGFNGIDTVIYTVCDNGLPLPVECVNDTLFVTVTAVNDPPVIDNEYLTTNVNNSVGGDLTDSGDFDSDGNLVVTTTPTSGPTNGSIVINSDGTFTYTPNNGFIGNDTVLVTICDDGTPLPINCTTDTIFIVVNPCDILNLVIDCDNDGVTNGDETNPPGGGTPTNPNDPCDYNVIDVTLPVTSGVDCDGDGVTDSLEIISGTLPNDPCDYNLADITVPVTSGVDCDGDGVTDSLEIINGTLPNDPCDYNLADVTLPNIAGVDCDGDGDGVTDSLEIINGTLPNDPCDYNLADITVSVTSGVDCDGDGVTDSLEIINGTLPNDPCDYNLADVTLPNIAGIDCDGDGVTDSLEIINGTLPNDPCDYNIADVTLPNIAGIDCDGDGVTDSLEIINGTLPNDPCDYNLADVTLPNIAGIDCDGDGVTDSLEIINGTLPNDPCDYNIADITLPIISGNDCDGDGISDSLEIIDGSNPFDPCSPIGVDPTDSDGDGLTDCEELTGVDDPNTPGKPTGVTDPNDPCDPIGLIDTDSDGDGLTDCEELTGNDDPNTPGIPDGPSDPNDPCSPFDCGLMIPEGFTPDGDGQNDLFVIEGIENYPGNTIIIFNRWGSKVYETSPYNNEWDGRMNVGIQVSGDELPTGTYFYILDTKDESIGKHGIFQGYVYLKR